MMEILKLKENYDAGIRHEYEFFNYICEDKSKYPSATSEGYVDKDDEFIIGESSGFLMKNDFVFINTHVFNETARFYEKHGFYCKAKPGEPDYISFYARETYRRKYGMTSNCKLLISDIEEYYNPKTNDKRKKELLKPLRISGDHYNFLNYGRIYRSLRPDELEYYKDKKGKIPKKKYGFPNFIDGQYWNFKIDEFIYNNGFHLCKSKARRKGFSFMRGSQAANTVNLNKDLTVVLAAYDLAYLTDPGATTDMVKRNLDWYETQTYWRRGYLSEDMTAIELGYKLKKEANKKYGFRSKILSEGCRNNESAVVGKDAFEIDFEEAGKFPNLSQVLDVTMSTTEDGDTKVGTMRIYGTGGTKDANWEAFAKIFFAPKSNEMMPFENVWDDNLRHTMCGFFFPQVWAYGTRVDEYGNSMLLSAWNYDYDRKIEYGKNNTEHKTIMFIGQRANRPNEAFLNTHENIFASTDLNKWIIRLKHDPEVRFYKDGMPIETSEGIKFKTNEQLKELGYKTHHYIEDYPINRETDVTGCMRMYHEPYAPNGAIADGVYFITSDSVGIDKDKKELTLRHSLNSFKVWTMDNNPSPLPGRRLVAAYCGRFNTLKEYDLFLKNVAIMYNAKILPEVNRGETLANFKAFKSLSMLLKDPRGLIEKGKYTPNAGWGMVIGDGDTKTQGLGMLKELLYTKVSVDEDGRYKYLLHYIYDLPFLLELQSFNLIGNFDRISDAILAAYQYKAFEIRKTKSNNSPTKSKNRTFNRLIYAN